MTVLYAFLIVAGLGALLGIGLAIAEKKLTVETDPKLQEIQDNMPGANCGGCGFAGCSAYAEAVYSNRAPVGLCAPGGQALADKMCSIMGIESATVEKKVAYVFCSGNCTNTRKDFNYKGLEDCNAASILFKGEESCKYGCLHLGSCIKVCPSGAISKKEDGSICVDANKCTGCGTCTKVCPNSVIQLIPAKEIFVVACNSHDKGPDVKKKCDAGCIGCKICETKFPQSLFKVDNFLAKADYNANLEEQAKAAEACPRKVIVKTSL